MLKVSIVYWCVKGSVCMRKMEELANCQNMTIKEAAYYSGIGEKRLYELTNMRDCSFVLFIGKGKRMIKRRKFDQFVEKELFV